MQLKLLLFLLTILASIMSNEWFKASSVFKGLNISYCAV